MLQWMVLVSPDGWKWEQAVTPENAKSWSRVTPQSGKAWQVVGPFDTAEAAQAFADTRAAAGSAAVVVSTESVIWGE